MSVYDLPTSRTQKGAIAIEIIFCIMAILITALRIYSRQKTKALGSDDALVCVATVLSIAFCVTCIFCIRYMFIGLPAKDVPLNADYETAFKWGYAMGVVYNPILALTKLSVLMFMLRFSGVVQGIRYLTWAIFAFNTCQMVAMFTVVVFQCVPFAKNWNGSLEGRCVDTWAFTIATSTLTIITDVVCITLPLYILAGLNMSSRKKLGLMVVFGFGILTTVFSCIRLYFLYQTFHSTNPDDATSITFTFSAIEVNLAIVAASAPGIWPLISGRLGTRTRGSGSGGASYGRDYKKSGWIKTNSSTMPTQRHVNGEIDLRDMSDHNHAQVYRGSSLSDSKEDILPGRQHDEQGIRKTTKVDFIVSDR
ncbi:putative Integral membrane protein [Seiridium unicorne]|uniref:Integral membrane protein n=1 Tax=Seiridium unicorne TaxID=138068 RepID=A0ABR2V8T6_9PEZI